MEKCKTYERKDNIIRRKVKASTIKINQKEKIDYKFEFDFIIGPDNKKRAIITINDKTTVLDKGQCCVFMLTFTNRESVRVKVVPEFDKEWCRTILCTDSKIKDEDI